MCGYELIEVPLSQNGVGAGSPVRINQFIFRLLQEAQLEALSLCVIIGHGIQVKMSEQLRLLLIEDDNEISKQIEVFLHQRAFQVTCAHTGAAGLEALENQSYHAVILDLCLPDRYGVEICREIKRQYHLPILILSAESGDESRIMGLQAGADDYMGKPFNLHELYIKVNKLIGLYSGSSKQSAKKPRKICFAGWTMDLIEGTLVDRFDLETVLTQTEFEILRLLAGHSHQLFSREQISHHLGLEQEMLSRTIDVHITRIREKLGQAGLIKSVRSHGYIFVGKSEVLS
jgi:DNA-binding response OmpR family regulator